MERIVWSALSLPLLAACASTDVDWRNEEGLAAEKIEVAVDASGRPLEIEYHIHPDRVPDVVREAMDRLHPGGRATAGEKEWNGATLYWELTKVIDGREVEAMFLPDGTLHSEEIVVDAAKVPDPVKTAVLKRMSGNVDKYEEIRDAERELVEYHVKLTAEGKRYKLRVSPGGEVLGVAREVPAEIEVPVE